MGCFPLHLLKACGAGPAAVRVMTVDGRCLQFDAPIIAKEVLMEYPCHTLFPSESVRSLGDRARPLSSTLSLKPGHVYFLIPQLATGSRCHSAAPMEPSTVPPPSSQKSQSTRRRRVSFATSADTSDLKSPTVEARHMDSNAGSLASFKASTSLKKSSVEFLPSPSEGVLRLKMVVTKKQLACVLREGGDCVSIVEGLLSPLLRETESNFAVASNISCNVSWRPSLQSIPESTSCPSSK